MTPSDFNLVHLVLLALAVFRITRLIMQDEISEPFREWVWKKYPPNTTKIGYLISCPWCLSIWVAVFLVVLYVFVPWIAIPVAAVFALSAVAGLIDQKLNN